MNGIFLYARYKKYILIMKKYIVVPIVLTLSVFVTLGITGLFLLLTTYPVLLLIDSLFGTNFHAMSTEHWAPDSTWTFAIIANTVLPLLYIPIHMAVMKKFHGKKVVFISLALYYIVLVIISMVLFQRGSELYSL